MLRRLERLLSTLRDAFRWLYHGRSTPGNTHNNDPKIAPARDHYPQWVRAQVSVRSHALLTPSRSLTLFKQEMC